MHTLFGIKLHLILKNRSLLNDIKCTYWIKILEPPNLGKTSLKQNLYDFYCKVLDRPGFTWLQHQLRYFNRTLNKTAQRTVLSVACLGLKLAGRGTAGSALTLQLSTVWAGYSFRFSGDFQYVLGFYFPSCVASHSVVTEQLGMARENN